jgi:hypothetical protein
MVIKRISLHSAPPSTLKTEGIDDVAAPRTAAHNVIVFREQSLPWS